MSKKVTDRSQPKKKKRQLKEISFTPLLIMGIIFILITLILGEVFPNIPSAVTNILYLIGILSLVVYMIQIAFEKRTGKAELSEDELKALKKQQNRKSKGK
ncbi:MAG: hypothetical protein Q4A83_05855 [Bacillota bacterium]|nr:hypothetical protein [Bacillota bacterium]